MIPNKCIYLDHAASTPVSETLIDFFKKNMLDFYANQESVHASGRFAAQKVEEASSVLLNVMGASPEKNSIFWTGSASEAFNMAMKNPRFAKGNIVTTAIEHPALSAAISRTGNRDIRYVRVKKNGSVDIEHWQELLDEQTSLAVVHHVHSETGIIQDLISLSKIKAQYAPQAQFMADTVQSFGKIPLPWSEANLDYGFISGRKIGCLPSAACIFNTENSEDSAFFASLRKDLHYLGRPEPALVITLSEAGRQRVQMLEENLQTAQKLNEIFRKEILNSPYKDKCVFTVAPEISSSYIIHLTIAGLQSAILVRMLSDKGVMLSAGSACQAEGKASEALLGMGYSNIEAYSGLRISLGYNSTESELRTATKAIMDAIDIY
jgi:cysteine desulfurase